VHPDQSSSDGPPGERLVRAARAAQQLCDVLWEALQEELRAPHAERVAELSERLAEVASTIALLTVSASSAAGSDLGASEVSAPDAPAVERRTPPAPSAPEPPLSDARPTPDLRLAPHPPEDSRAPQGGERRSALEPTPVERPPASHQSTTSEPPSTPRRSPEPDSPVALQPIFTRAGNYTFTKLVDEHDSPAPIEPVEPPVAEIEIRDVRREEGPSAWVSSVGRLLARHAEDGLPFAVLLVEIVDVARLERSETPHDLHSLVAKVEGAMGRAMRASDHLSRETLGRYWLVAPETNGTGARMLAERLARLVRTSASHRGVPMEVAIGIAVCPDDGTEAPALAARADLGVYSARATGRSIAHTDPPS
jgi:GGDEF domain-containing protein